MSFKYHVFLLMLVGFYSLWGSSSHTISNHFSIVTDIKMPFCHFFSLTGSNDSVYKVLIPLQQNGEGEEQILSKSLLLNLSISGSVLKGTSLVVVDKDHVAVLGSLAASGEESKGN